MPTYEYVCRDCSRHLEVVQSFRDAPLTTCGTCGGPLRKVFSAAGIIFKGSGYYVTDSRNTSATPDDDAKKSADVKSADVKSKGTSSSTASTEAGTSTAESA
jgi:putative FmdB family regulatory protein